MANPERGLFDSDEDLAAYLARLSAPPEPYRFGGEHTFAPGVQARINAEVQPQTTGLPTITPSIGATLGPLSLDGGLQLQQAISGEGNPYTRATPTIGAGLKLPLFGGDAELKAKYTPEQLKMLELEWKRKLLGGEIGVQGRYTEPYGGRPDLSVGIRGRIPF